MRGVRRSAHGEKKAAAAARELEQFTISGEVSHLTRVRSQPCHRTAGRSKPPSKFELLAARESGRAGGAGFFAADRAYVGRKHVQVKGSWRVDDMDSEAYVLQFSANGSLLVAGFRIGLAVLPLKFLRSLGQLTAYSWWFRSVYPCRFCCIRSFSHTCFLVIIPSAGALKKISDLGVPLVALIWSFQAYIWLNIILEVWSPKVITLWEVPPTVLQYGLLLLHAYTHDKCWPYVSIPLYDSNPFGFFIAAGNKKRIEAEWRRMENTISAKMEKEGKGGEEKTSFGFK